MTIDEVKKELAVNMEGANADYANYPENGEYPEGYASGCEYAIELLEDLQEKKVVIPQFVADLIEKAKVYYGDAVSLFKIVYWIGNHAGSIESHYKWLNDEDNQKLLFNAIANGYKVEEPRRVVKLKGIHGLRKYVRLNDEGKVILGLAGSDGITGGALTEEEAKKKWPEFEDYNNAGLLEFEEVEDE
ncbi:DUF1642 domain-containing protein [Pediococcus acidilactici]|uniref:DUF1642 domain-containing protein n=1 Tax=Pediococcus acidilactici TaxID=1254 RepID=UPI001329600E|nr:DUF1642 domain-containing protein [Pediococcus acidilactici]KAF0335218.1 DUF1642 domain-containing protein [Pediococcus acidilactici]KAF0344461.1 DUF1642 domain-containing protein [Pediococcus acidilactici]KAF0352770.1 DUF1642 domain-containing protein [Pediococcus acidilactici]KAF0356974.1 DUF1642 domain-containing protein [Pediococcus acidilactici]KAF0362307.1 DUF1642 domain-containing protein [Pediococcus acidilactici]